MCGIAGAIGSFEQGHGVDLAARMTARITHRGPDDLGLWAGNGIALGMRRLSIIDLEAGHQPMWTEDGVGIVYNGEIYNYLELRARLKSKGYRFKTRSDTEVVLNLYHCFGPDYVDMLEGMFAICIYDPGRKRLHLARDRFGIKPLYYARIDKKFLFASEIKSILAVVEQQPDINLESLSHYLTFRFVPQPGSMWKDIRKLEPGHCLDFDIGKGTYAIRRFWQIDFRSQEIDSGRDYPAEFSDLFLSAVEKRLVASDVPVGVMLSGGIDSSAVSAAAVELGHRNFHTFSVGFAASEPHLCDETRFAQQMANHVGAIHHSLHINQQQFIDFLPDFVRFTDEPLADLASIPLYYLSKLAREHVKVVLSGEGADEILAGYTMQKLAARLYWLRAIHQALPGKAIAAMGSLIPGKVGHWLSISARYGVSGLFAATHAYMCRFWTDAEKQALLRFGTTSLRGSDALLQSWYDAAESSEPIDQLQQVYCHAWLVDDLLMKADKMSMAASLELRVPFLDHHLAEWAATLPMFWKVGDRHHGWESKRILRMFARDRLPAEIINRPKQGFPVPVYHWLQGSMGGWAHDRLCGRDSRIKQYIHVPVASSTLKEARKGNLAAAHKIWILIILDEWLREWT